MLNVMKRAVIIMWLGMMCGGCVSVPESQDMARDRSGRGEPRPAIAGQEMYGLGDNPGLSNYIAAAAAENPGLKAAFFRWRAAIEKAAQSRWLDDPSLTYEYFVQQVATRQQIGLMQSIPGFGKRSLRAKEAGLEADVAWQEVRMEMRRMVGDVKDAYYDYYYLGRALAVAEESVQLLKSLEDVTLTQYGTATTDFSTVIKVQIERDRLKSDVAALKDQQQVASARLAAVLGLPSGTPLPLPTRLPESPAPPADVEKLVMTNNPELDALQRKALAEDTSARLARRSFLPDFSVGVNFMTMSGPEDDNETDQSIVAGVTLPLWIGKYRAEAREAEARSRAYQLERTDKANALGVDLKMAIYAFRDAERRKALYRDSLIPQAEQALKVIRQAFSNGKADFSEVIDAQRNLLEFRLQWERACVDREKSLANIDRIAGKDPDVLPPGEWNAETKGRNDEP